MRTIHTSVPGRMDVRMVHMILDSTPFYKISHVETEKTTPKTHSYAIESAAVCQIRGGFFVAHRGKNKQKSPQITTAKRKEGYNAPHVTKEETGAIPVSERTRPRGIQHFMPPLRTQLQAGASGACH